MKKNIYKKVKVYFILFLLALLTTPMFSQKNDSNDLKNQISLSYGLNIPSGDYVNKENAQFGSNFSISYTRNIWKTLVISAKYVNLSNSEEINKDLIELTITSPSSYGSWTGTSSKFNASAFLVGIGQNFETGKNKKLISGYKLLIGSNSFSTPDYNFKSSTGIGINRLSETSNALIYDLCFSLGYKISQRLVLFIESDIYKSNIEGSATATATYLSNTSSLKQDYNISYNTTSLTFGLGYIL